MNLLYPSSNETRNFDNVVEALNAKRKDRVFFLEVGAMDGVGHDALHPHISKNEDWEGVLVEPLPDMFQKLQKNYSGRHNLRFENSAITDQIGTAEITRIPEEYVDGECPAWADGISTLRPDIHIIGRHDDLAAHSITQSVRTTTIDALVTKYNIERIDLLQIDVEGFDKEVFDQVWQAGFRPELIKIEVNYLTYVVIKELRDLLEADGYGCFFQRDDMIATKV